MDRWWRSLTDPELKRTYGFLADRIPADVGPPVQYAPVTPPAPHTSVGPRASERRH